MSIVHNSRCVSKICPICDNLIRVHRDQYDHVSCDKCHTLFAINWSDDNMVTLHIRPGMTFRPTSETVLEHFIG